jgi:hypothetical protein
MIVYQSWLLVIGSQSISVSQFTKACLFSVVAAGGVKCDDLTEKKESSRRKMLLIVLDPYVRRHAWCRQYHCDKQIIYIDRYELLEGAPRNICTSSNQPQRGNHSTHTTDNSLSLSL